MIRVITLCYLLYMLIFCFCVLYAAPADHNACLVLKNYSYKEYNGYKEIWSVMQDDRGVMYFGNTSLGILEYDGSVWTAIPTSKKMSIRALAKSKDGTIYAGGLGDLGFLKTYSDKPTEFVSLLVKVPETERDFGLIWKIFINGDGVFFCAQRVILRFHDGIFSCIKPDMRDFFSWCMADNTIYVQQTKSGWSRISKNTLVPMPGHDFYSENNSSKAIEIMHSFGNRQFLIGTRRLGLFLYDGNKTKIFYTNANKIFKKYAISCSEVLPGEKIAIGTLGGGIVLLDKNGKIINIINESKGLINNRVYSLFLDSQNLLWVGTSNGLSVLLTHSPFTIYTDDTGIEDSVIGMTRHQDKLFITTAYGVYVGKTDSPGLPKPLFVKLSGINEGSSAMLSVGDSLLLACGNAVYQYRQGIIRKIIGLSGGISLSLAESKKYPGFIFVGQTDGLYVLKYVNGRWSYYRKVMTIKTAVNAIFEDKQGVVWLGTQTAGIFKIEFPDSINSYPVTSNFSVKDGLPAGRVVFAQYNDDLFLGTHQGVFVYNRKADFFTLDKRIPINKRKPGPYIQDLYYDHDGLLWIIHGIMRSLFLYEQSGDTIIPLKESPLNFLSRYDTINMLFEHHHTVWISTDSDELIKYNSRIAIDMQPQFSPLIRRFFTFTTEENEFKTVHTTSLAYEHNNVRIEYAFPDYFDTDANTYRIWLEGYMKDWSEWTSINYVEYTNLNEGDYTFHLKAKNVFGAESREVTLHFSIAPPFYRSIWAYGGYCGFFILIILAVVYIQAGINKRKTDRKLVRYELLLAKIDTHFMFNTLNTIVSLVPVKPNKAVAMIERFSFFIQSLTAFKSRLTISLKEELRIVESYLKIMKVRFTRKLKWNISVQKELLDFKIPQFVLQPVVENSIKHNLLYSETGGEIDINIAAGNGKEMRIRIEDTIYSDSSNREKQEKHTTKSEVGLKNIKERLRLMYGKKIMFATQKKKAGYVVTIIFPLQKA